MYAPGQCEQRVPRDRLPDVVALDVTQLVRDHDPHLGGREATVEQCVPDDDPPARPKTLGLGIRKRRVARDVLDSHRNMADVRRFSRASRSCAQRGVGDGTGGDEIRADERIEGHEARRIPAPRGSTTSLRQAARAPSRSAEGDAEQHEARSRARSSRRRGRGRSSRGSTRGAGPTRGSNDRRAARRRARGGRTRACRGASRSRRARRRIPGRIRAPSGRRARRRRASMRSSETRSRRLATRS